jgi:alpha-soluble NSF attachment protein
MLTVHCVCSPRLANKLWLKEADIAALEGDYYRAIQNFEKVADSSLENHLMKYSVKDYFFKAGLCILATKDLVSARRNLQRHCEKDPSFAGQREAQLLSDLIEAIEQGNQEMFTDKLYAYDQMSRLDRWKSEILLRVKNQIEEADNEFS